MTTAEPTQTPDAQPSAPAKKKSQAGWILAALLIIILLTQVTFFAVPPIGAIPNGITLVMLRGKGTKLFDSPDAMCLRTQGSVSLLCRGAAISAVAENSTILLRLPYIDFIYTSSTGGKRFDR